MPEISELNIMKISPERFLNACSAIELFEVDILIRRRIYQDKMSGITEEITPHEEIEQNDHCDQEVTHELMEALRND